MNLKYQLLQAGSLSNGQVRGRYAPSPSGMQHMGNIQTAVVAWLQARLSGGEFALRMDDIDVPRVKPGSADQILDDLRWLGLDWDVIADTEYRADAEGVYCENRHLDFYEQAFSSLQKAGYLYPCVCSRKMIREKVGTPNAAGHFVYPGNCRARDPSTIGPDQPLAWRFRVPDKQICFTDILMGEQSQNAASAWGDIIVKRRGGLFAYQLVSVVDDIWMGVTDVVRGADLMESTHGQIALYEVLVGKSPRFWHLPLRTDEEGNKLAKRDGSDSLQTMREAGLAAGQVVGQLAFELGLIDVEEVLSLPELLGSLQV